MRRVNRQSAAGPQKSADVQHWRSQEADLRCSWAKKWGPAAKQQLTCRETCRVLRQNVVTFGEMDIDLSQSGGYDMGGDTYRKYGKGR